MHPGRKLVGRHHRQRRQHRPRRLAHRGRQPASARDLSRVRAGGRCNRIDLELGHRPAFTPHRGRGTPPRELPRREARLRELCGQLHAPRIVVRSRGRWISAVRGSELDRPARWWPDWYRLSRSRRVWRTFAVRRLQLRLYFVAEQIVSRALPVSDFGVVSGSYPNKYRTSGAVTCPPLNPVRPRTRPMRLEAAPIAGPPSHHSPDASPARGAGGRVAGEPAP
jgi:hypothetical protein